MIERDSRSPAVVVGAGVSGLSVALTLIARGHRVTVLERGEVGAESSWAGGGILFPLLPWDYPPALSDLALRSMGAYEDWIRGIERRSDRGTEFWRCGMRVLGLADPVLAWRWCKAHGLDAETSSDESSNELWLPGVAQIRNPQLVAALREAIVREGGVIRTHESGISLTATGKHVTGIVTSSGRFTADCFVIATGAWAGLPLSGAGVEDEARLSPAPNIRPIRGQMLLFKLAPGVLDTILYRNGLYLIPRRDGHVLVGSTIEDVGFDKSTDDATLRRLHAEAAELLPALRDAQPIRHWAGLRPGSPDNIPVIDRHPDFDNVYINAGHYRYGVTLAPASSELLADLIEGKVPAVDPTPYEWAAAAQRRW